MTLSEKIYSCRRKAGLTQEELAERLGVSRQAVGKWESGEAEPELRKLQALAKEFSVTADWLLSEEDTTPTAPEAPSPAPQADWADRLPRNLKKLFHRYGWIAGVYLSLVSGAGLGLMLYAFIRECRITASLGWPASVFLKTPGGILLLVASVLFLFLFATAVFFTVKLRKKSKQMKDKSKES